MADIQFDITLDLVEKYVPAENVTVVQEDYQSVKFVYTILNREQPADLSGATDIVVSFVKPDGHIVLQNDGTLVNGKIELVANPQAFTYVGKTYFQVQYKIGSSIYNTRQAFLWVERGNTSCQTLSSTDFAPMLDQAIQAGQMLSGIDLQALIDSKVTAENAQADVDALELQVGALEVTIVGLDSRVDALEASQAVQDTTISGLSSSVGTLSTEVDALQLTAVDHETRIDGLEKDMPNLDPINTAITAIQVKDVEQDGRIGANETAISGLQTKNTQQDTAISANASSIVAVDTKVDANKTAQDTVNSGVTGSLSNHSTRIDALEADATVDDARITNLEGDNTSNKNRIATVEGAIGVLNSDINDLQGNDAVQDSRLNAIETKNANQDVAISDNTAAISANKADADSKITGLTTRLGTAETDIVNLKAKDAQQDTRMNAIENKDSQQDGRLDAIEGVNTVQNNRLTAVENKNTDQDTRLTAIEGINTTQNTRLTDIENKNTSQDTAIAGKISKSGDTITGTLLMQASIGIEGDRNIYRKDNTGAFDKGFTFGSANIKLNDWKNNRLVWEYDQASNTFNVNSNTNLVKKDDFDSKTTQQDNRLTAIENYNSSQDTRLTSIESKNTTQDGLLSGLESTKASKTYVDSLVSSVASGSPKGVYPTLAALQSSKPSGDGNIYIITADGKWYYWNGTVWTAGGMYQSTGIANSSVDASSLNPVLVEDFNGKKCYVNSAGSFENGSAVVLSYDVTSYNLVGLPITVSTNYYSESDNISQVKIKVINGNSVSNTGTDVLNSPVTLVSKKKPYQLNFNGSYSSDYNFIHVYIWNYAIDINSSVEFYYNNLVVKVNGNIVEPVQSVMYPGGKDGVILDAKRLPTQLALASSIPDAINNLYNKKINVLGDSITAGHTLGFSATWGYTIAQRNNMTIRNYGINGTCLAGASNGSGDSMSTRYVNMDNDADYIIVMGGTNDQGSGNIPIGSDSDTTVDTFKGALNILCKGLLDKYPKAKIGFMTPFHNHNNTNAVTGLKIIDYVNAINTICENYSIPVLDNYRRGGLNPANSAQRSVLMMSDGIHPNVDGHKFISTRIEGFINSL